MRRPVRFYLVGGSVLIDLGLRAATLDIDYVADADDPAALAEIEQAIRAQEQLDSTSSRPVRATSCRSPGRSWRGLGTSNGTARSASSTTTFRAR